MRHNSNEIPFFLFVYLLEHKFYFGDFKDPKIQLFLIEEPNSNLQK